MKKYLTSVIETKFFYSNIKIQYNFIHFNFCNRNKRCKILYFNNNFQSSS